MPSDLSLIAQQAEALLESLSFSKANTPGVGLVKKPVAVHRQGKVFIQERLVREGQEQPLGKPSGRDKPLSIAPETHSVERVQGEDKFSKEVQEHVDRFSSEKKSRLNAIGEKLRSAVKGLKEGDRTKIKIKHLDREVVVERLHGSLVRVGGMTVGSLRAGTLVLHGLEEGTSSAAEVAAGTTGAGMEHDGAERTLNPVIRFVEHATNREARKEAEAKYRRLHVMAEAKKGT